MTFSFVLVIADRAVRCQGGSWCAPCSFTLVFPRIGQNRSIIEPAPCRYYSVSIFRTRGWRWLSRSGRHSPPSFDIGLLSSSADRNIISHFFLLQNWSTAFLTSYENGTVETADSIPHNNVGAVYILAGADVFFQLFGTVFLNEKHRQCCENRRTGNVRQIPECIISRPEASWMTFE